MGGHVSPERKSMISVSGGLPKSNPYWLFSQNSPSVFQEGYLTAHEISAHHLNMESFFDIKTEAPAQWLLEQDAWSRGEVAANKSAFWSTLGLLLEQHTGMMEGYWAAANQSLSNSGRRLPELSVADFLKLSAVGEVRSL